MKKLILIALLFIGFKSYAQFDKGGIISLSGVSVFQLDTSARNIIHIIEDERIAGGGVAFNSYERFYVNYIVTNLKSIGVWYKCKAIYGFVGGTAAAHKWNWKDMRNLDVAFRLTYGGTIIHSNNGMQGDGSTGYANTYLNPSINLANGNNHISAYSALNVVNSTISTDAGCLENPIGTNDFRLIIRRTDNTAYSVSSNSTTNDISAYVNTDSRGYYISNCVNNTPALIKNGAELIKKNSFSSGSSLPNNNIYLLATYLGNITAAGQFSNKQIGIITIGNGLTNTEAISTSNIINYAQTMRANF